MTIGHLSVAPRSWLFVPADRAAELLPKALSSGADAVIIDLEDGVPRGAKSQARLQMQAAIIDHSSSVPVFVRPNPVGTPEFDEDLAAAAAAGAVGLVLPKCNGAADVTRALPALQAVGRADIVLVPLLESARAILYAAEIASADERVVGLAFGAEDLTAELGQQRTLSGREVRHAREHVVLAAIASGRWAVDTPCMDVRRREVVQREARIARQLGFAGKLAIHPSQIEPIHAAFTPTKHELDEAIEVLAAFQSAQTAGSAVCVRHGLLIDEPVARAARRTLERASRTGG